MNTSRQSVNNNFFQFIIEKEEHRSIVRDILFSTYDVGWDIIRHHPVYLVDRTSNYVTSRPVPQNSLAFTTVIVDEDFIKCLSLLPDQETKEIFLFPG